MKPTPAQILPASLADRRPRGRRVLLTSLASSLALLGALGAAAPAAAGWGTHVEDAADGRLVEVRVRVDGAAAPLYGKPGAWDRHYFQAFRGRNYSIEVRNTSGERIGVLMAVDGLNVVNGERTSLSGTEPMYVLDPYETATIRGWRTSLADVRRFVFVDEERSYAERTGQANGDMGWIRVLAFRESRPAWRWVEPGLLRDHARREDDARAQNAPAPSAPEARDERAAAPPTAGAPAPQAKTQREALDGARAFGGVIAPQSASAAPGTGWGDRRSDPVREVDFLAERNATDRITLRYEYASGLRALGIDTRSDRDRVWQRERGELGFAKPPQW